MHHISPGKYKTIWLVSMFSIISKHKYFLLEVDLHCILPHFRNVSNTSRLAHALKVTISKGGQKLASKLSGMKVKITNFHMLHEISLPTSTSWDIHILILVMFVGADLENFLDIKLLLCILIRNLPICIQKLSNLFFKL